MPKALTSLNSFNSHKVSKFTTCLLFWELKELKGVNAFGKELKDNSA